MTLVRAGAPQVRCITGQDIGMISKAVKIAAVMGVALVGFVGQAHAAQQLTVSRNGMLRVSLPSSASSVIVANPEIADVNVVDSHTVYVIGRGYGSAAVTVLDRLGHPIFEGQVMVTAGQHDSVTMYKGSKPSVMVCSNVCEPAQEGMQPASSPAPQASAGSGGNGNGAAAAAPAAAVALSN